MLLQQNIPLAPLTTFGVGGPARYFVEARSEAEVLEAVDRARGENWPLFVLGGGSNLVVSDQGWPGLVLKIGLKGVEAGGGGNFDVAAGEEWDAFVAESVARDCAGIECLSGIPGTVGGTPVQNVGAYGQEVAETVTRVRVLDLGNGRISEMTNADCGFAYRTSIFNTTARGRYIVLRVSFALRPGGAPRIEYADLKRYFADLGAAMPSLAETRQAVREIRWSKAMLIVPGDDDSRSAGSFFKNPILPAARFTELAARLEAEGKQIPNYPAQDGMRKVSAAWLVEQAGFAKGATRGAVGISRRHSLAIVNRGGATAADINALKDEIQRRVREVFGVELQPEPVFVGF